MTDTAIQRTGTGGKINDEQQYVVFQLGAEVFGVDINKIKEIITYRETTQLPGTGHLTEGVINLRGTVIPVFCLRKKFGFYEAENDRNTRIVVVEVHDSTVGIVVDAVAEVLLISGDSIEEPSSMVTSDVDDDYITGIAKLEDRLVIILDLEKVINPGAVSV
ncbi:chemotaxis protein CheW [Phosphitispora fastidiosa]|uniref:chemotaxis protein CheW n=1 Tax=Phosphitispora fastidiosa TaxID=2837202 RepID=UPI001E54EF74|nr:chemotaxis protein CheW [Phosphitispora fastidiosa]MBU7006259.1 purine-binding chemotaxis protein CheW [Phosphitispora fastidiosa]